MAGNRFLSQWHYRFSALIHKVGWGTLEWEVSPGWCLNLMYGPWINEPSFPSCVIPTDLNVSTAKREIANCVLAAVYIPMELWGSFYHWVEWQNIACTQHTSCKTCKNFKCFTLNFWTIIVPKWTSSTLDDPNLIKLWNV